MQPRHHEVTRLEGFSDAVFAFALTLLVVSLEVPQTFEDLHKLVLKSVPFGLMFAMMCWVWYEHNLFFRRYGLQDGWTIFLNCALLFVVLFYVYPLKFLTMRMPLPGLTTGEDGGFPSAAAAQEVMMLYGIGLVLIFGVFAALYSHAYRQRKLLTLTPHDLLRLEASSRGHLLVMAIGMLSIAIAVINAKWVPWAGFVYFLIGPALTWNGYVSGRAQRALDKKLGDDYPTP